MPLPCLACSHLSKTAPQLHSTCCLEVAVEGGQAFKCGAPCVQTKAHGLCNLNLGLPGDVPAQLTLLFLATGALLAGLDLLTVCGPR
jgi:hypothetical protein